MAGGSSRADALLDARQAAERCVECIKRDTTTLHLLLITFVARSRETEFSEQLVRDMSAKVVECFAETLEAWLEWKHAWTYDARLQIEAACDLPSISTSHWTFATAHEAAGNWARAIAMLPEHSGGISRCFDDESSTLELAKHLRDACNLGSLSELEARLSAEWRLADHSLCGLPEHRSNGSVALQAIETRSVGGARDVESPKEAAPATPAVSGGTTDHVIAWLRAYHCRDDGPMTTPLRNMDIASEVKCCPATVTRAIKAVFGESGHDAYVAACTTGAVADKILQYDGDGRAFGVSTVANGAADFD